MPASALLSHRRGAQSSSGACVTHIGPGAREPRRHASAAAALTPLRAGGAGNYVKMIHNGIEYGDMQLISEARCRSPAYSPLVLTRSCAARSQAYDILKHVGKLTNDEMANVFEEWNKGELESFLIEITTTVPAARGTHQSRAPAACAGPAQEGR